jgi:hypothetical protein
MYRIREVDGNEDEIADTLADIHRLTFFDGASIPEFDRGTGGWRIARRYRWPLPGSFRRRTPAMRGISAMSAY